MNNRAGPAVFIAAAHMGVKDVRRAQHVYYCGTYCRYGGRYQTHRYTLRRTLPRTFWIWDSFGYNHPTMAEQKIDLETTQKVAKLARLALPQEKLQTLTQQLESILEYVAKIGEVDVSGVEPMAHALPLSNVLREDVAEPGLPLDKVLQNAPETDGPFFKVPKVIGGDEDSAG